MNSAQTTALKQLRRIARNSSGDFELITITEKNGALHVKVSLNCKGFESVATGLKLREREQVVISVPEDFPFQRPHAFVRHRRFAGFPHVQWMLSLCLYAAPSVEWDPSDGMYGFISRLDDWFRKAALDALDPVGEALHPPVAYVAEDLKQFIVVHANTPAVSAASWLGFAALTRITENRLDLREWIALDAALPSDVEVAAVLLLANPISFEFPDKLTALISNLQEQGVGRELLLLLPQLAARANADGTPQFVMIGAPMRGARGSASPVQHLSAWYINPTIANGLRLACNRFSPIQRIQEVGQEVQQILLEWADSASTKWCNVLENRQETTIRRDKETALEIVRDKSVMLWGCGALGAFIAEILVLAGVNRIILHDNGIVKPGLLVRQNFEDRDVCCPKSVALEERLKRIRPDIEILSYTDDLLTNPLGSDDWTSGVDLIIDSTASEVVLAKLETMLRTGTRRCPVVALAIDSRAERGLAICSVPKHSGGPYDVLRRAKITACSRKDLQVYANAFWSREKQELFRPEPGCSDPTFIGSHADVAGLAADMLNLVLAEVFSATACEAGTALFVQRAKSDARESAYSRVRLEPDMVVADPYNGFEFRITAAAFRDIRGWIRASGRNRGHEVETGGALFGEIDEAVRVVWISEVSGPPPDSDASAEGFVCGVEGLLHRTKETDERTRGAVRFVGMWHTHPSSLPVPSATDLGGMIGLVTEVMPSLPQAAMLIIGGREPDFSVGGYLFEREDFECPRVLMRPCRVERINTPEVSDDSKIGLALSGGGSRAIAFELGCLRALHDVGLLDRVGVISSVSGGSVLAAMFAYSNDSFEEFDQKVVGLLRRGLQWSIAREFVTTRVGICSMLTTATAGLLSTLCNVLRKVTPKSFHSLLYAPLPRWYSRTDAFEGALRDIFGHTQLSADRRNNIDVVINACELRTGSAFRFGSQESGSYRFGRVNEYEFRVSEAVAASAAYPIALPALDRSFTFKKGESRALHRVAITDGGVYDNLGVTCLLPGRDPGISTNVYPVDYIISCDAGHGLLDGSSMPYWFGSRIKQAFLSTYQRTQAVSRQNLHELQESGKLCGFILCYLGMDDARLPWRPANLVPRNSVNKYPTDFAAMKESDITLLADRGEQLMRVLVTHYLKEI